MFFSVWHHLQDMPEYIYVTAVLWKQRWTLMVCLSLCSFKMAQPVQMCNFECVEIVWRNQISQKRKKNNPGQPCNTSFRRDRLIKRLNDPFNIAARISSQIKADLNKDVSRHTVSWIYLNWQFVLSMLNQSNKRKEQAKFKYAQEHIVWKDENLFKVYFSDENKFIWIYK